MISLLNCFGPPALTSIREVLARSYISVRINPAALTSRIVHFLKSAGKLSELGDPLRPLTL